MSLGVHYAFEIFRHISSPLSSITNIINEHVRGFARRKLEFNDGDKRSGPVFQEQPVNFFHMKSVCHYVLKLFF